MHWKALFDYKHLGCQDLPREAGTNRVLDMVVSIKSLDKREVIGTAGKKDIKPVAELNGAAKPMILNKTNLDALANLFGSTEYEDFIGKPFTIYQARVKDFGGKGLVDGLRIRDELPVFKLPELTPDHKRWQGALAAIKAGTTTVEDIRKNFTLSAENEKLLKQ